MTSPRLALLVPVARRARDVAAALVAPFWRGEDARGVAARLEALPPGRQAGAVGAVLGLLFLFSLFAAQFGLLGLAVFWLAVMYLVA